MAKFKLPRKTKKAYKQYGPEYGYQYTQLSYNAFSRRNIFVRGKKQVKVIYDNYQDNYAGKPFKGMENSKYWRDQKHHDQFRQTEPR